MPTDNNQTHKAPAGFLEVVRLHVQGEVAEDVEQVLATICESPHYEIHPAGYVLTTRDAVREFYTRMLPMFGQMVPDEASATFEDGDANKFVGPLGVMTQDFGLHRDESGRETQVKSCAFFVHDPESGLMKGEYIYTNTATARIFRKMLGDDFANFPGVSVEGES